MTKNKNVPKLRFLGFGGEWEIKRISQIVKRVVRRVDVVKDHLYQQIGIRSHGKGIFHKEWVTGESLGDKRVFWVQENVFVVNIVFAWEQAVARTTKAEVGMIASHRFPMYEALKDISHIDYILWFFLGRKGKALLELASPGGAGRNKTLGQAEFEKLKLNVPVFSEQQKIAAFLSTIDTRIQQLTRKKALLEQYKKGVMQGIFSRELRFKDEEGKEYGEWEEKRLGGIIVDIKSGKTKPELEGKFPVYGSTGEIGKCDKFTHNGTYILVARVGANAGILNLISGEFSVTDNTLVIELQSDVEINYIYYLLVKTNLNKLVFGSGQPLITGGQLKKLELPIPTLPEQQKIAAFLTALDAKIAQVAEQITHTQAYKKGLLQQMFV